MAGFFILEKFESSHSIAFSIDDSLEEFFALGSKCIAAFLQRAAAFLKGIAPLLQRSAAFVACLPCLPKSHDERTRGECTLKVWEAQTIDATKPNIQSQNTYLYGSNQENEWRAAASANARHFKFQLPVYVIRGVPRSDSIAIPPSNNNENFKTIFGGKIAKKIIKIK